MEEIDIKELTVVYSSEKQSKPILAKTSKPILAKTKNLIKNLTNQVKTNSGYTVPKQNFNTQSTDGDF